MSKIFKNEAELATHVISWLREEGWVVHQEVEIPGGYRTADIVAEKDGKIWIIECKNTFTEAVLDQCYWHMRNTHYVSCAVPGYDHTTYSRSRSQGTTSMVKGHFLRCHGIG
jgi:hypothetical protein